MLTLIRNADVYAPEPLGRQEVLVIGSRIAAVAESIDLRGEPLEVVDGEGLWLLPGFVDPLTHPAGGGGEGGFGNRTSELEADDFIRAGVTTPV
ncbi:MAG: beta-aspartyl-peptidase, partial [Xanthomonadales bacterium]|nr:beta-aspartyl-peptidase [Xanthomonadales bacterium]